jgi:DUF4097 and DUF4098 domain-containing protein YvlB
MKIKVFSFILLTSWFVSFVFGAENTIKQSFPLSQQGSVRLETARGDIDISTHSGNEVKIEAIISADDKAELEKMKLIFEAEADSVFISTTPDSITAKANIEYFLKVPENLKSLQISTLGGEIKSRGTFGDIDFKTTNGDIDFRGEFSGCQMASANGDIDVYIKNILKGDISVKNDNGSIKVTIKPDSGFTVEGSTVTGSIRSEFSTRVTSEPVSLKITGTVNNGDYKVQLSTVNGDIQLLRSR